MDKYEIYYNCLGYIPSLYKFIFTFISRGTQLQTYHLQTFNLLTLLRNKIYPIQLLPFFLLHTKLNFITLPPCSLHPSVGCSARPNPAPAVAVSGPRRATKVGTPSKSKLQACPQLPPRTPTATKLPR